MAELSGILRSLSTKSLVALVPGLDELTIEKGRVQLLAAGSDAARAGRVLDQLIIPIDGSLKLFDPAGEEKPWVGYVHRGQSLALANLLENRPLPYGAKAETQLNVLYIPRGDFMALLARHPKVLHYLRLVTSSSGVRNFVRFLGDKGFQAPECFEILSNLPLDPQTLEPGEALRIASPQLHFIRSGRVHVETNPGAPAKLHADVGEGIDTILQVAAC
jgi:hypothetical protein